MLRILGRIVAYFFLCFLFTSVLGRLIGYTGYYEPFFSAFLGITLATWIAVRGHGPGNLEELGLAWHARRPREIALGIGIPFFLFLGLLAAEWTAGWLVVGTVDPSPARLFYNLWVFSLVAWYEELSIRGYLFRTMLPLFSPWMAVIVSAAVFAVLHAFNPGAGPMALGGVFLAGLVLGTARLLTDGLYLPMAFHFSWNFFQAFFGFPVSGQTFPGFFRLVREGPSLYTGGPFGPEAGLLGFMALLTAGGIIFATQKRRKDRYHKPIIP